MLRLPGVTLLTATSVSIEDAVKALRICTRQIEFAAVRLLAPQRPASLPAGFEYRAIAPMKFLGYSRFILKELHEHFDTPHCLVVQADGFIINPGLWRDEFLHYDYIGAPWREQLEMRPGNWWLKLDRNRVGNGGFSLRSHKLMKMAAAIDFEHLDLPVLSEDLVLCHYRYEELHARGVTYAPVELAARFSMETQLEEYRQHLGTVFGFHGKHLLEQALRRLPPESPLRVGRNDPCPCGSGKRFKHCHGQLV
jgi:hypothetical protein